MNDQDDEIVREFLEESRENLDQLDRDLVALESRSTDPELLAQVFRTFHTIKGTCGFLGYRHLEGITHAGENLLSALRDGSLHLDAASTTSLLRLVDAVRSVLATVEATGTDGDDDHAALIADLERHLHPEATVADEPAAAPAVESAAKVAPAEATVRIDVAVLDKLLDLVGELVVTRAQIGALDDEEEDTPLSAPYRRLRLLTDELSDGVMAARLQPIATITGKLGRVVRDLAADLGKRVRVEIEGTDLGVDKTVNEALRDPLLHLVRNAVDHGIELPDTRVQAGKPAEGLVRIRAHRAAGRIHLELSDDGRGIDTDRLVARAIATGVLSDADAAALSPQEARQLVFRAGLSTKDGVTKVSGRGVGMDVVQAALHQIGGSIAIDSAPGQGTVTRISVPLTLAVVPTLVVRCAGVRYVLPQLDVVEILRLEDDGSGAPVALRDRCLPLVHLADVLRLPAAQGRSGRSVAVVRAHGGRIGVILDAVEDTAETIVKPLPAALRPIAAYAGVTILGDGQPALVLDAAGVAASADVAVDASPLRDSDDAPAPPALLVVRDAAGRGLAIPLAAVRRIEQVPAGVVDRTSGVAAVPHLGGALPLFDLSGVGSGEVAQVVVCDSSIGPVGLLVHRVEDLVASVGLDDLTTRTIDVEDLVAAGPGVPS